MLMGIRLWDGFSYELKLCRSHLNVKIAVKNHWNNQEKIGNFLYLEYLFYALKQNLSVFKKAFENLSGWSTQKQNILIISTQSAPKVVQMILNKTSYHRLWL